MNLALTSLPARVGVGPGMGGLGGWLAAILLVAAVTGVALWVSTRKRR